MLNSVDEAKGIPSKGLQVALKGIFSLFQCRKKEDNLNITLASPAGAKKYYPAGRLAFSG